MGSFDIASLGQCGMALLANLAQGKTGCRPRLTSSDLAWIGDSEATCGLGLIHKC